MKAITQKSVTPPVFEPIDLVITIESKRELELLYCIFNASAENLTELANKTVYFSLIGKVTKPFTNSEVTTHNVWSQLSKLLRDGTN